MPDTVPNQQTGQLTHFVPKVTAIVLNWNCWESTVACVQALRRESDYCHEVVIVDNHSSDESVARLASAFPDLTCLRTDRNLGYAGGNNVGISFALAHGADFVLVINPDVILDTSALNTMLTHCASMPKVGALCPVVRWKKDSDRVWFGGAVISWIKVSAVHEYAAPPSGSLHVADWATGCCLLLSSSALNRVGLFDPDLFLYWEEVDLCRRLLRAGFWVGVDPDAQAFHDASSSVGLDSPRSWYYFSRNAYSFFFRYAPEFHVPRWWVAIVLFLRFTVSGVLWALINRDGTAAARLLGFVDFLRQRRGPCVRYSA